MHKKLENKATFSCTAPTATKTEDIAKNADIYLKNSNEAHKKAKEFLDQNPGASVTVSSSFTGMSFSLFKSPEEIKKFLEKEMPSVDSTNHL